MEKNVRTRKNEIPAAMAAFNGRLGFPVKDPELLRKVFVHRSHLNEPGGAGLESNERIEFLGDSVLSTVISRMIYERFPRMQEGDLTRLRARLVNKRQLAQIALQLGMGRVLLLGKGEAASGGAANPTILAGALEALIAAVYLDSGFAAASEFVGSLFAPLIEGASESPGHFDYKPELQMLTQKLFKASPAYRLLSATGAPHRKVFEVEVVLDGEVIGRASGAKKKDAEQEAAREALKILRERHKA